MRKKKREKKNNQSFLNRTQINSASAIYHNVNLMLNNKSNNVSRLKPCKKLDFILNTG